MKFVQILKFYSLLMVVISLVLWLGTFFYYFVFLENELILGLFHAFSILAIFMIILRFRGKGLTEVLDIFPVKQKRILRGLAFFCLLNFLSDVLLNDFASPKERYLESKQSVRSYSLVRRGGKILRTLSYDEYLAAKAHGYRFLSSFWLFSSVLALYYLKSRDALHSDSESK